MTGTTRRIGWGILSTGHIASVFAQDLALLPDEADLVAVGSRSLTKAEAFANRYSFKRAYGSYAELVADPEVDVVYVATPHTDHAASARLCLEAGKAVLVEKPLTVSADEAGELLELASRRRLFVMEAMWNRMNPLMRKAAALVASGELGPVRHLAASFGFAFSGEASHRLLDPDLGGGAILDLGVYPVHVANLFLGEPDDLVAYGNRATTGVDAQTAALLRYAGRDGRAPATASLFCSLEVTVPTRLDVFCAEGSLTMENFIKPEEMLVRRGADGEGQEEHFVTQLPGRGYTFQAEEVMRCLRLGAGESPLVPQRSTCEVMRTLDRWRAAIGAAA